MTRLHWKKAMLQIIYGKIQTTQSTFTIHQYWLKKLIGENYVLRKRYISKAAATTELR